FFYTFDYLKDGVGIPGNWIQPIMSIGQIAEIATMAVLGYVLKTLGWRTTMIVGVLGHAARFAVFAYYPEPWAAILINLLHGVCYAFFFATVYIFVDEYFPKDIRASAQGLFNVLILGIGPLLTNLGAPFLSDAFKAGNVLDYKAVFLVPTIASVVAALLLLLFFHPPRKGTVEESAALLPASGHSEGIRAGEPAIRKG
ncbi:MAG: MFS transporter, partial [Gemmataceae bacterium]|nr:MFS transporter [Gemmataceae bacterium]